MAATSERTFPVGFHIPAGRAERARDDARDGASGSHRLAMRSMPGTIAARLREAGARAGYGAPIVVDGRIWGAMTAVETAVLADDAEDRLAKFTELIAIAISNAEARDALSRLAAEQASLRRVATLVARGSAGEEFFSVVAEEVRQLFDVP